MKIKKSVFFGFFFLFAIFVLCGARHTKVAASHRLTSVHIVDRNGFSETISSSDRLKQYENVDFLQNLPYQKVMRVFGRDEKGDVRSYITSYYSNGQPKQYLEVVNGRAIGKYYEWHANGAVKLEANVIGGSPDITEGAESSWLFDGMNCAWDEEGRAVAEVSYEKGILQGPSIYYHTNGKVWKVIPFQKNEVEGTLEVFLENGELLQTMSYVAGVKHGPARRYWNKDKIASEETYENGLLLSGVYSNKQGELLGNISEGKGFRYVFTKDGISEMQQYYKGAQLGEVRVFNAEGILVRTYHVKNGLMHGEETEYYIGSNLSPQSSKPRFSVNWYEGKIHGVTRTWYDNGQLESQREMSSNKKNGVLTAWFKDGNMMLLEEYDHDRLVKGQYFKRGEKNVISRVHLGKGTAMIYDGDGHFLRKINYENGKPV